MDERTIEEAQKENMDDSTNVLAQYIDILKDDCNNHSFFILSGDELEFFNIYNINVIHIK